MFALPLSVQRLTTQRIHLSVGYRLGSKATQCRDERDLSPLTLFLLMLHNSARQSKQCACVPGALIGTYIHCALDLYEKIQDPNTTISHHIILLLPITISGIRIKIIPNPIKIKSKL